MFTQILLKRICFVDFIQVFCNFYILHFYLWAFTNYSRLSLSRIPRDSLKYFEISVVRHIRFAELWKK